LRTREADQEALLLGQLQFLGLDEGGEGRAWEAGRGGDGAVAAGRAVRVNGNSEIQPEGVAGVEDGHPKRLCVRWLDELIIALWHDLQGYMEWKVMDQALLESKGEGGC
jgi:hypothetical protein